MDRGYLLIIAGTMTSLFPPIMLALVMSSKQWKAAQEKARERRMADHRMDARLLRMDI